MQSEPERTQVAAPGNNALLVLQLGPKIALHITIPTLPLLQAGENLDGQTGVPVLQLGSIE
jgi:hypothetical protein